MVEEIKNNVETLSTETKQTEVVQNVEVKQESLTEQKVETKQESLSETQVKTEEVKTETVKEELKTEVKPEIKSESEQLNAEIIKTKEELSVIKEVREELVSLYGRYKEIESSKESLSKTNEELVKENSSLKESLSKYVLAEKQVLEQKRKDRLESLSQKFKSLGQEKSVEMLSAKDDATLLEFETIVDAALKVTKETLSAPTVTVPSQGTEKQVETLTANVEQKKEQLAKPTNKDFFGGLCKILTNEQRVAIKGSRAKEL